MPTTTQSRRRAIGNSIAQRQGIPTTQAAVDALWGGIVTRLNATLAARGQPDLISTRALQGQAEVDSMWGSIATKLNAEAGLAPARRAR